MSKPVRWRVCTGSIGLPHTPQLLAPSAEDEYEGAAVVKCLCFEGPRLRRNCKICEEKYSICKALRKDILPFDYRPIATELQQLSLCRTQCHEFLKHWRQCKKWRGVHPENHPPQISKFWDDSKFRIYQAFWDPEQKWEVPVKCNNENCFEVYHAFPNPCQELSDGWDDIFQEYKFRCSICSSEIISKKIFVQVSVYSEFFYFYNFY